MQKFGQCLSHASSKRNASYFICESNLRLEAVYDNFLSSENVFVLAKNYFKIYDLEQQSVYVEAKARVRGYYLPSQPRIDYTKTNILYAGSPPKYLIWDSAKDIPVFLKEVP